MFNYIAYDLWYLQDVISSFPAFYQHSVDAYFINKRIIESIQFFKTQDIYYLDNIKYNFTDLLDCSLYLDQHIWNWRHRNSWSFFNNHMVWDHSNSLVTFNMDTHNLWIRLYDSNPNSNAYFWLSEDKSLFRTRLHDFGKSRYDIQYISPLRYKHHDWNNDIYLCSSFFWEQYLHTKTVQPGFHFFWYENYGSVEIPLKTAWAYWYQLIYPAFEMHVVFDPSSQVNHHMHNVFSASHYYQGWTKMVLDYTKPATLLFTE